MKFGGSRSMGVRNKGAIDNLKTIFKSVRRVEETFHSGIASDRTYLPIVALPSRQRCQFRGSGSTATGAPRADQHQHPKSMSNTRLSRTIRIGTNSAI